MSVVLDPYVNFRGEARQAMEFYQGVFGGELRLSTFKEYQASHDPSDDEKIMHAQLESEGIRLMAADTPSDMEYQPGTNFNLSLSGDDEPTLRGYFEKLQDGGTVVMPLEKATWGDMFGMVVDRFGVSWLVNVNQTG